MNLALPQCRVVVTRSALDAEKLGKKLQHLGAEPINVPMIEVTFPVSEVLTSALASLIDGFYDWAVVTSANGAKVLSSQFQADSVFHTGDVLQRFKLAAVGRQSAAVLEKAGLKVDLLPAVQSATALVKAFPDVEDETVAAFLGDLASDAVVAGLTSKGYSVTRFETYLAKAPNYSIAEVQVLSNQIAQCNAILFTSPSTVKRFATLFGVSLVPQLAICIGPSTAAAATEVGIDHLVAQHHSQQGLLTTLCEAWKRKV